MFDLWGDENSEGLLNEKTVEKIVIPEEKDLTLTILNETIKIDSKKRLDRNPDYKYLQGVKREFDEVLKYEIPLRAVNAYILRYLLRNYSIEMNTIDSKKLTNYANKLFTPKATLHENKKHIVVYIPPIEIYKDLIKKVNGYPLKSGLYHVNIVRSLDLEYLNSQLKTKLPKIVFDKKVKNLTSAPIPGFDGTIKSLKEISVGELNVVKANHQTYKEVKKSNKTIQEKLEKFGIETLFDLISWLPRRYIDKSKPQDVDDLIEGEPATIIGEIINVGEIPNNMGIYFIIETNPGKSIKVNFWRQKWLKGKFKVGSNVIVTGKYSPWRGAPQLNGTSISDSEEAKILPIVPVYKQSESKGITTAFLMSAVRELFSRINKIDLPTYLQGPKRIDYYEAFKEMHLPSDLESHTKVINSLAYYELVYMQILIQEFKEKSIDHPGLEIKKTELNLQEKALKLLPFELTDGQKNAVQKMNKKLAIGKPSQTLLNADVGAGKGLLENELILTPKGWAKLNTLKVGDSVIGSDGNKTKIIGYYPQGEQEIAKIYFNDKTEIITDLSHLWTVKTDGNTQVLSTKELLELHKEYTYQIPLISKPVNYEPTEKTLQLKPYTLGLILGDINILFNEKLYCDKDKLLSILIYSGIPKEYHMANPKDRELLIKGYITAKKIDNIKNNVITITENRVHIIKSIISIVQSLGGIGIQNDNGTITLILTESILSSIKPNFDSKDFVTPHRVITKVELLNETRKTICIKVSADDELFITKDFIVTHNTIVAQLSALRAVESGYQAAIMAPTDVLAVQLYETFKKIVTNLNDNGEDIKITFLSGSLKAAEKREVTKSIKDGSTDIIVGTPSIMSKTVEYANLGFVCIDEQQKFGAEQRSRLLEYRKDGYIPDLLMQTATPIPRSTAQVVYGDIDMILLKEKPPGRKSIITKWIEEDPQEILTQGVNEMWSDILEQAEMGNQTFVITPLVNESTTVDSASVKNTYEILSKNIFPNLRIGHVHGQMKNDEQKEVMQGFRDKKYDILVASTVVEVGVDIPDATRVVILSAYRLGASSLHQIRGRVGRNSKQSICYLVSLAKTENSQFRLQSLVNNESGFEVAKDDLLTRGEGTLFSTNQSGASEMMFASLTRHSKWVNRAKDEAISILNSEHRDEALKDCREKFKNEGRLI